MTDRKISICIPTWERPQMTIDSFVNVHEDERVSEIIIVDDHSSEESFNKLLNLSSNYKKVKVYRNDKNVDCYKNKLVSLSWSSNEWCILLDSDNAINKSYLDAIFSLEWNTKTCYMPSFAAPMFDYRHLAGLLINKSNVAWVLQQKMGDTMLNCMNYFVNRNEYIRVWQSDIKPHTADSILQNYNWFAAGNEMFVVPGLEYFHRVHAGSHYQQNVHLTGNLYQTIIEKLKSLQ